MELRVLKYFLMIAQEENITRAAQRLNVTQPTLSRQLMQMEEELGVKLFKRGKHSISLTEDGILLKQRAQEIINIEEKIREDLSHSDDMLTGTITIGSGETCVLSEVAKLAASFRKENPKVMFEVCSGIADDIKDKIENGTVDIGLLKEPVDISKYEFVRLGQKEKWGVIMRKDCPLAEKEYITPKDLAGQPLIFAKRESVRNEIENWFGDCYDNIEIAASCDLIYNTESLVKGGVGLALCIDSDMYYDDLCFKPLSPTLETGTVIVWRKNRTVSPSVNSFIKHIKKCLECIV